MKRIAVALLVALSVAACKSVPQLEDEPEPLDSSNAKATAIEYILRETNLGSKDLVYVAGPSLEIWDQWCGFDTGEPGEEPHDEVPAACAELRKSVLDVDTVYPPGSNSAIEITEALAPILVEFIEDPDSVFEPFEEGMMVAPIKNDAGLLVFGLLIEADGKVYLPVGAHGEGWLFERTPTQPDGGGWSLRVVSAYIA